MSVILVLSDRAARAVKLKLLLGEDIEPIDAVVGEIDSQLLRPQGAPVVLDLSATDVAAVIADRVAKAGAQAVKS